MTNYFTTRVKREIGSDSRVGFLLTSVDRKFGDSDGARPLSESLRQSALTGGFDGYTRFGDKSWILEGSAYGTKVDGTEGAIGATQESSARYFQRPDATSFHFDPTRTSLSGWGGTAMLSKASGRWRPVVEVQAYSPGFETNDVGFLQRTDIISTHAVMQYVNEDVTPHFREKNFFIAAWQNRNFDGDTTERGFYGEWFGTTSNYSDLDTSLIIIPGSFDDRLTRGGPIVRTPTFWAWDGRLGSDNRKKFSGNLSAHLERSQDDSYTRSLTLTLTGRPMSNLQVSIAPSVLRSLNATQYVTAFDDADATQTYGKRYVFAHLDQRIFELGTRADWTVTSRLSFQLYLQPFVAAGDYHDYRSLVAARTRDYAPTTIQINPNFNFRSLRGNAVVRWEFRPGSAIYFAWNENRADLAPIGDFRLRRDVRAISGAPSHDVFLVKVSYWLPL